MTAFGVPSGRFSSSDHSSAARESGELTQGAKDDCTCARQLPQWAQAWAAWAVWVAAEEQLVSSDETRTHFRTTSIMGVGSRGFRFSNCFAL